MKQVSQLPLLERVNEYLKREKKDYDKKFKKKQSQITINTTGAKSELKALRNLC